MIQTDILRLSIERRRAITTKESMVTESTKEIPVLILNGFLGSGKTTLLTSLIVQAHKRQISLGVVVNDMSKLDVDGLLVAQTEFFEQNDTNFQSIYSCVLSSRAGIEKLNDSLNEMTQENPPELLVIETSGSCHPMPLVEFFSTHSQFKLTGVLTLVDSAMIDQDYDCGKQLIPTLQRNLQNGQRDTTNLLVEQIMFCSHLLLTKADRIAKDKIKDIAKLVEVKPR